MIIKKFMLLCWYLYTTMLHHYALFHITLTLKFGTMLLPTTTWKYFISLMQRHLLHDEKYSVAINIIHKTSDHVI